MRRKLIGIDFVVASTIINENLRYSVYCPHKETMPQTTFASHEELYSIFDFKNQIEANQFADDLDDDWECNDVSVIGKCFLEVDDRIKIEGNLVETTS